jgi:multiple sugar transport system substrate-binding protein
MNRPGKRSFQRVRNISLLLGASAIALAACGSSTSSAAKSTTKTTSSSTSSTKAVTISFMEAMSSGALKPTLEKITSEFEKAHPNIHVDLVVEPSYGTLREKEEASVAAGDPPTIGQAYENWAAAFADSHAIVPLTSYVKSAPSSTLSDFWTEIKKDLYLPDGKIWMWPFNKSDFIMYYNATALAAMHMTPPKTWSQFATDAKKLTKNGKWAVSIDPGTAADPANGTYLCVSLVHAFGGHLLKDGKPDFDNPAALKALQYLQGLVKGGEIKIGTDYPGQTALGAERSYFDLSTVASYHYNLKATGGKFKMGTAPMPSGPAGQGNEMEGTNIVLFSKATPAQRKAAWEYMLYLSSPKVTATWAEGTGYLPVDSTSLPLMKSYDATHTYQEIAAKSLDYATPSPAYSWWTEAIGDIATALQSTLIGHTSPAQALKTAQAAAMSAYKG